MTDQVTYIEELKQLLLRFKEERNWSQFHDAKNLAEAISIEAAELQELFLWKDSESVMKQIREDANFKCEVEDELADIIAFCINFANATDIDISTAIKSKVAKNAEKYPVKKARNTATKYTKL
ncbi:nucleotide pyrophosphohydrolase [Gammaproteobacteria bacterium]|jgi:NTP pyrophosphatase (non-canonical NTP hydrolase)|nr:nucleotide pyrophosphohydrolase [Gammaproteobacteria bacterium]